MADRRVIFTVVSAGERALVRWEAGELTPADEAGARVIDAAELVDELVVGPVGAQTPPGFATPWQAWQTLNAVPGAYVEAPEVDDVDELDDRAVA